MQLWKGTIVRKLYHLKYHYFCCC